MDETYSKPLPEVDEVNTYSHYSVMNPRLIFCAITTFGSDSHLRDKPASELILQALTGAMGYVGSADQPPYRVGMNVAAAAAGVAAAQAILAALVWRSRIGEGQASRFPKSSRFYR
jgi:CoA:oxalate CoA-transferase